MLLLTGAGVLACLGHSGGIALYPFGLEGASNEVDGRRSVADTLCFRMSTEVVEGGCQAPRLWTRNVCFAGLQYAVSVWLVIRRRLLAFRQHISLLCQPINVATAPGMDVSLARGELSRMVPNGRALTNERVTHQRNPLCSPVSQRAVPCMLHGDGLWFSPYHVRHGSGTVHETTFPKNWVLPWGGSRVASPPFPYSRRAQVDPLRLEPVSGLRVQHPGLDDASRLLCRPVNLDTVWYTTRSPHGFKGHVEACIVHCDLKH